MKFSRVISFVLFLLLLLFGTSQTNEQGHSHKKLLEKYHTADKIYKEGELIAKSPDYVEEKEEKLNQEALNSFHQLEDAILQQPIAFDSLLFFVYFKSGVLEHYFDNFEKAKEDYINTIRIKDKLPNIPDSFLFKPYLYYGIILYNENYFDSSLTIYKKAEAIARSYSQPLNETERLFNTLGALYYETGNYRQAKNYFEKALAVISPSNPYYKELVVNYKINLASILTRLEQYEEANNIYQELLPLDINRNIILHNIGVINLKLGAGNKALGYFKQVNYTDNRKQRLYNDIANAYHILHKEDSALEYIKLADTVNNGLNRNTVLNGQTYQTWGDILFTTNDYNSAIAKYQQAIINYYPPFAQTDVYRNPLNFSGVFSFINLFNTLTGKGESFEKLYFEEQKIEILDAALAAYQSAFKLAEYVERSYDSDEARLFLSKIKYGVHSKPIDISLLLFEKTGKSKYIEQAWQFDQENKASILSYNIFENAIRDRDQLKGQMNRERSIRSALTRLSLKASTEIDKEKLRQINNSIRDNEILLGKIRDTITATNSKNIRPPVKSYSWFQKNLLDNNAALLSYHLSENELLIFCITQKLITYRKLPVNDHFYAAIDSFTRDLHNVNPDQKFDAEEISKELYTWLINPVFSLISEKHRLIIIPDDELNYLPFEALQDSFSSFLIEKFSVQYQYSASLLSPGEKINSKSGVLAFAPFADISNANFGRLKNSAGEISGLKGRQFINQEATKENFNANINRFPIIHLATHAQADDREPLRSFISFGGSDTVSDRLYAGEIYNLNLDSTKLVILSACETGTGQLVHGEGLMSLSRAFAYAGCRNIVTSLWKAEDQTTMYLVKKFHKYLSGNKTADQALRLAKLDLLKSGDVDVKFKSPNYWAHLVFIGNYEAQKKSRFHWWLVLPIFIIALGWFIYSRRNKRFT